MRTLLTALLLLFIVPVLGCELPQNKTPGDPDTSVSEPDVGDQTWYYLSIVDESEVADSDALPGADIDAIVIVRDGTFIFAGCGEATLFGEDDVTHGENPFVNPANATLGVREQSKTSGFVSLAGGTLFCELPLAIESGDEITIWEVAGDTADSFSVVFATAPSSGESATVGPYEGTVTFTVP